MDRFSPVIRIGAGKAQRELRQRRKPMQFALMIYHTPEEFAMRKNDYSDPHLGAWRAYYQALVEAGVYVGANGLETPKPGTTEPIKERNRRQPHGPYPEMNHQLSGSK